MKGPMALPQSAVEFISRQVARLRQAPARRKLVFPEGDDPRVLEAAARLAREGILEPVLIGRTPTPVPSGVTFIDPTASPLTAKYSALYHDRRRAKGVTGIEAARIASGQLHFAALMTAAKDADAMVGSAVSTTAEYVRAVIECIGLAPEFHRLSSAHLVAVHPRQYGHNGLLVFSDAAIIAVPSAVELAEIAIAAASTARALFETEPLVAMLSFSTKGSARHKEVDKVVSAMRYIRERVPGLNVDGELQADAALVPAVGRSKSPGSPVAGRANTLVFPDLNSANIGYKLVERLGDGALIAVLIQGIARPASIVSRGCTAEDVYNTAVITAAQAEGARAAFA
jgi:phosphate acetyltransferase